jgi:hypothetical protein
MNSVLGASRVSSRTAALTSGIGLLLMAVLAPIVEFNIFPQLLVATDAQATLDNVRNATGLLRGGIFILLIVVVLDMLVAWGLYLVFKPVNRGISLLTAWFRLVYSAIFALALNNLLNVVHLAGLNSGDANQVLIFFASFRSGWNIGLFLFGIHLLLLGWLAIRSGFIPRWLGALISIAGIGYLADGAGKILISGYSVSVAMYTFIGEVLLIFWLIWLGIKGIPRQDRSGHQSA